MDAVRSLISGAAGAASLNLAHESARHLIPNAPHVDLMAMKAVGVYVLKPLGLQMSLKNLRRLTMAGDLISNSLYYAAVVGAWNPKNKSSVWKRALLFGVGAGILTVALPPLVKLGQQPSRNLPLTAGLTVAWYTIGNLVAAAVFNQWKGNSSKVAG